jgi:hypothetical protein
MADLLEQAQECGFVPSSVQAVCAASQRNITATRVVRTAQSANLSFCSRREQRLNCIFSSDFAVQVTSRFRQKAHGQCRTANKEQTQSQVK